jgi:hypothetical protein
MLDGAAGQGEPADADLMPVGEQPDVQHRAEESCIRLGEEPGEPSQTFASSAWAR